MARPRLKSGAPAHEFTSEERSAGGRARAERIAADKAEARKLALEQLAAASAQAVGVLEELLGDDKPDPIRLRAAVAVLDIGDRLIEARELAERIDSLERLLEGWRP